MDTQAIREKIKSIRTLVLYSQIELNKLEQACDLFDQGVDPNNIKHTGFDPLLIPQRLRGTLQQHHYSANTHFNYVVMNDDTIVNLKVPVKLLHTGANDPLQPETIC